MLFLSALINSVEDHNTTHVVHRTIETLGIKVNPESIRQKLTEHPDFPSLLSVNDVLHEWNVSNVAIRTDIKKLNDFPLPFIASFKNGRYPYLSLVRSYNEKEVEVLHVMNNTWEKLTPTEFSNRWSGIVMLLNAEDNAGETDYEKKRLTYRRKRLIPVFSLISVLAIWITSSLLLFAGNGVSAWSAFALLSVKLFGTYVGGLLLWYEIDKDNKTLKQVCQSGTTVNCHAVLQSAGAKFMGISWSETGFIYFAGGLLTLLTGGFGAASLNVLAWINVLALPYTIYSVYYQGRVLKQWCLLCITVQIMLVLEFAISLSAGKLAPVHLTGIAIIQHLVCFLLPAMAWFLLKPSLSLAKESQNNQVALTRMKRNPQIFESLLMRQKEVTVDPTGLGIMLGNPNGKHKLIKVCNPYCGPCSKAHPEIEALIHSNPDLQVQIIFTADNKQEHLKTAPVKHLLAIAEKGNNGLLHEALDDWYGASIKNYDGFANKYPLDGEFNNQAHKIDAMNKWCLDMEIRFTPTIFIQGRQMPETYKVTDLKFFLT